MRRPKKQGSTPIAGRLGLRLTGISCPIFGVSWEPAETDRKIVRDLFGYLEDRRVLYNPYRLEVESQVIQSVLDMRRHLTDTLASFDPKSDTADALRAMRAACRRFLDNEHMGNGLLYGRFGDPLLLHLGELRSALGLQLARLAVMYGIGEGEVEPELLSVFPPDDGDERTG